MPGRRGRGKRKSGDHKARIGLPDLRNGRNYAAQDGVAPKL
ncbi:hypothetical protein LC55x_1192 [Lysobacter capsici]|nr:hypothetical protein LC55x_1192 [Lysobacter capsici]